MGTVVEFDSLLNFRVSYSLYWIDPACGIGDNHLVCVSNMEMLAYDKEE